MIGISGRCPAEPSSSSGLYAFPFERPRTSRVHVPSPSAKRDAKSAEPKILGGPFHYAMGVFNSCLTTSVGLPQFAPPAVGCLVSPTPSFFGIAESGGIRRRPRGLATRRLVLRPERRWRPSQKVHHDSEPEDRRMTVTRIAARRFGERPIIRCYRPSERSSPFPDPRESARSSSAR
jgi:hypothetical protein